MVLGKQSNHFPYLSLEVIPCDDVTHGPQRRGLNGGGGVDKQLDKTLTHTSLDDSLDLVILSIREIAQGPASVRKNLLYKKSDKIMAFWRSRILNPKPTTVEGAHRKNMAFSFVKR